MADTGLSERASETGRRVSETAGLSSEQPSGSSEKLAMHLKKTGLALQLSGRASETADVSDPFARLVDIPSDRPTLPVKSELLLLTPS